jgi:hypothetical protein
MPNLADAVSTVKMLAAAMVTTTSDVETSDWVFMTFLPGRELGCPAESPLQLGRDLVGLWFTGKAIFLES